MKEKIADLGCAQGFTVESNKFLESLANTEALNLATRIAYFTFLFLSF